MLSLNNRLILEEYKKEEIKTVVSGGFARMQHKISLKPLKVLVDAKLADGTLVPARSIAFLKEEYLHNANNRGVTLPTFQNDSVSSEPFIIVDMINVDMIDIYKEEPKNIPLETTLKQLGVDIEKL